MHEFNITTPAHLMNELKEVAEKVGVSIDQLASYFFAVEVVHT